MRAKDFRTVAREKLKGNWLKAVGATFVAALLGGLGEGGTVISANIDFEDLYKLANKVDWESIGVYFDQANQSLSVSPVVIAIAGIFTAIASVWSIATSILAGPIKTGLSKFNINLFDGKAEFNDLFEYFDIFLKAFLTNLLMIILIVLQYCLLIVPGIIATYAYQMTFYILADHPDMDPFDAIKESRKMMKGNKWRLFCLQFSFIGWAFLSMFTLGIGSLFLAPYIEAATAAFYKEISKSDVEIIDNYQNREAE